MRRSMAIVAMSYLTLTAAALTAVGQMPSPEAPSREAYWKRVQDICNATANVRTIDQIEPAAEKIAATAEHEHQLWGGHEVDHTGRLYKFGLTETENEQEPGDSNTVALHKIGWWNVWRYLTTLSEAGRINLSFLRVTAIDGAVEARVPDGAGERRSSPFGRLFGALDQIGDDELRKAAKESVIRSAISDRPWSAVFISYVVHTAIGATAAKTPAQFDYSASHIDYIYQAFQASQADEQGSATSSIYRACPAQETTPRRGDLICYHRQKSCEGLPARAIQNLVGFGDRPNETCHSIRVSHCDVVTHVDQDANKVYTVGGNVFQSVTRRRMNLTANGLKFSSNQGDKDCADDKDAAARGRCSLNSKDWFVILQMRPTSDGHVSVVGTRR